MSAPGYFAVVPADVRYHKNLCANAKLLYAEITALADRTGICWASNDYFAELYQVDKKTISRWISQLNSYGFIEVKLQKSQGNKRQIGIHKNVHTYTQNNHEVSTKKCIPIRKKVTSINMNNNTINNTMNERGALSFFQDNFPTEFERLMMQFKKQIDDFVRFGQLFDATVEQEGLAYDLHVLSGRFKKFALNWIANQKPVISIQGKNGNDQLNSNGPVGQAI